MAVIDLPDRPPTLTDPDPAPSSRRADDPGSDGEPPSRGPEPGRGIDIDFQNPCRYAEVGVRALRPVVAGWLAELAPGAGSLAVRFTSDREMRRLNGTFRHRDKPTDVLSFPGDYAVGDAGWPVDVGDVDGAAGEGGRHLGDIAIAVPTARRQAADRGHDLGRELRLLLLHGLLHCLGHDHEQDDGEMEALEDDLRRRFGLAEGAS